MFPSPIDECSGAEIDMLSKLCFCLLTSDALLPTSPPRQLTQAMKMDSSVMGCDSVQEGSSWNTYWCRWWVVFDASMVSPPAAAVSQPAVSRSLSQRLPSVSQPSAAHCPSSVLRDSHCNCTGPALWGLHCSPVP